MDVTAQAQRTTVTLEPDVLAGVEAIQQGEQISLSGAVNLLARAGLTRLQTGETRTFRQRTAPLGLTVDVSNVAETLDLLDGDKHR